MSHTILVTSPVTLFETLPCYKTPFSFWTLISTQCRRLEWYFFAVSQHLIRNTTSLAKLNDFKQVVGQYHKGAKNRLWS